MQLVFLWPFCLHLILTLSQVVRDIDKDLLGVQRGLGAVVEQRRKKKRKRGPNKWMPFRLLSPPIIN